MNNVNTGCLCGQHEFKNPTKEELDKIIAFLKEFWEINDRNNRHAQPYRIVPHKTPCLFDNLPDGAYGLACPCPKHGGMC